MESPLLTVGTCTRDDHLVWATINGIGATFPHLMDRIEIVVVDNSTETVVDGVVQPNKFATELEKHLKGAPNVKYIRAAGPPSSCLYKDMIFRHATGKYVVCCDSHVLFEAGTLEALLAHFEEQPETNDLIMGPVLSRAGNVVATHQRLYDNEPGETPKDAKVYEGVVCRGNQLGVWTMDPRGLDRRNPPFEIQQNGTGAFACRREAWPGFNPSFTGFGGNETYLMEKFRRNGGRVLCHPGFRWIHSWYDPDGKPYTPTMLDKVRNYLVGFSELGRDDLATATIKHFSTQNRRAVEEAVRLVRGNKPAAKAPQSDGQYEAMMGRLGVTPGGTIPRKLFDILRRTPAGAKTLEFGSGLSTLVFDANGCKHTAIEHDPKWVDRVRGALMNGSEVIHANLTGSPPWYSWEPAYGEFFDVILIDGPPGNTPEAPGRLGAIGKVEKYLAPGGKVVIDDTHRPAEAKIAATLAKSLGLKPYVFMDGQRKFHVLEAPPEPLGEGPGTELKTAMDAEGFPACQQCVKLARQMNAWGVEGCRENLDEIIKDILPRAQHWLSKKHSWAQKFLGLLSVEETALRLAIKTKVEAAIAAYEKKLAQSPISPSIASDQENPV